MCLNFCTKLHKFSHSLRVRNLITKLRNSLSFFRSFFWVLFALTFSVLYLLLREPEVPLAQECQSITNNMCTLYFCVVFVCFALANWMFWHVDKRWRKSWIKCSKFVEELKRVKYIKMKRGIEVRVFFWKTASLGNKSNVQMFAFANLFV